MKLVEAIQIGRASNCVTIGDVDYLIGRLFKQYGVISENEYEEYCADYDCWCDIYETMFSSHFVDCKIGV